jgi:transposase
MPHPQTHPLIGLPYFELLQISGTDPIIYEVRCTQLSACPHCQSNRLRLKDSILRLLRHISVGLKACFLKIRIPKYQCLACGKYFRQPLPGVLPYQHSTEAFRQEVAEKHQAGIAQSTLRQMLHIGTATVERHYRHFIERKVAETKNNPAPLILGVDEHFFTRKQGYATSFADLAKGKIHDVVLGRSEENLRDFLKNMKGKSKTQVAVIDLSETYRSILRRHFHNALIVADRFHVIRLINRQFMKTWNVLDPEKRKDRNLSSLLRYHEWNLEPEQHERVMQYLEQASAVKAVYDFKQRLCRLIKKKHQTAHQCRKLIPIFLARIHNLKESGFVFMRTLGETLENWKEEIVRMWRFTQTNSTLEGLHTKMEMISRRAFGFRNFGNYRLRVKALCG